MDTLNIPLPVVQVSAAVIVLANIVVVAFILVYRIAEAALARRRAPSLKLARQGMLLAATSTEPPVDVSTVSTMKTGGSSRAMMLAAVKFLSSLKGQAHDDLVEYLDHGGYRKLAVRDLHSKDGLTRGVACELLGALAATDSAADLVELVKDNDRDVRKAAVRAVGRLRDADAASALIDSLEGDRSVSPIPVAAALLQIGPACEPVLRGSLHAPDPGVRAIACRVIGLLNLTGARSEVIDLLQSDSEVRPRIEAAHALGRLGGTRVQSPLLTCLASATDPNLRAAAAGALAGIADKQGLAALTVALDDPSASVCRAAGRAIVACGPLGRSALAGVANPRRAAEYAAEFIAIDNIRRARSASPAEPDRGAQP